MDVSPKSILSELLGNLPALKGSSTGAKGNSEFSQSLGEAIKQIQQGEGNGNLLDLLGLTQGQGELAAELPETANALAGLLGEAAKNTGKSGNNLPADAEIDISKGLNKALEQLGSVLEKLAAKQNIAASDMSRPGTEGTPADLTNGDVPEAVIDLEAVGEQDLDLVSEAVGAAASQETSKDSRDDNAETRTEESDSSVVGQLVGLAKAIDSITHRGAAESVDNRGNKPSVTGLELAASRSNNPVVAQLAASRQEGASDQDGAPSGGQGQADMSAQAKTPERNDSRGAFTALDRFSVISDGMQAPKAETALASTSSADVAFDRNMLESLTAGRSAFGLQASHNGINQQTFTVSSGTASDIAQFNLPNLYHSEEAWADSFGEKVLWMSSRGTHSATLHLHPAELGSLQVRVSMNGTATSIEIHAHNSETRDLIESMLPKLHHAMEGQNIKLDDVKFTSTPFLADSGHAGSQQQSAGNDFAEANGQPQQGSDNSLAGINDSGDANDDFIAETPISALNNANSGVDYYA